MTEQQKKEIENISSIQEWDNYVDDNNIAWCDRVWDIELGNTLHTKRFCLLNEVINKNGKLNIFNIGFNGEYHD